MLRGILRIISRDGFLSRTNLARELNIPKEIIDEGINQLLQTGYLSKVNTGVDCATSCANCSYGKNCGKEIIKAYRISDKGNKYLKVGRET